MRISSRESVNGFERVAQDHVHRPDEPAGLTVLPPDEALARALPVPSAEELEIEELTERSQTLQVAFDAGSGHTGAAGAQIDLYTHSIALAPDHPGPEGSLVPVSHRDPVVGVGSACIDLVENDS